MSESFSSNYSDNGLTPKLHKKPNPLEAFFRNLFISFLLFQIYRTNFLSLLKLLQILGLTPFMFIARKINKLLWRKQVPPSYKIKDKIESTTTQIYFSRSKLTGIDLCMKLWPKRQVGDSSQEDPRDQLKNLLEGLSFNRHFAPGIYLGIAPVDAGENAEKILRGDLIINPGLKNLKPGKYVIVMRNIRKEWKLDYKLRMERSDLRTIEGMEFLARQIADMHAELEPSPEEKNCPDIIASKLAYNIKRLKDAISMAGNASMLEEYDYICRVMNDANYIFSSYFEQRRRNGHIKRCHGDLKTSNLWVSPRQLLPRKLFAFDCIDFKFDFCHIDTLSDIAMLAVDIQQVLSGSGMNDKEVGELRTHFLDSYLKKMQEEDNYAKPLLEYYMTEKAMVCSYVSFLLDDAPDLGKIYFSIAYQLAQDLEKSLVPTNPY